MSALRYLAGTVSNEFSGQLMPLGQLERLDEGAFDWQSTGTDPSFEITSILPFYGGWTMVEIRIDGDMARVNTRLYFDLGAGWTDDQSVRIQGRSNSVLKRLVILPEKIRRIRFDPVESEGNFAVRSLRLIPVPGGFAQKRMLRRIHRKSARFAGKSDSDVKAIIRAESGLVSYQDSLLTLYNQTFDYNYDAYENWILKYESPRFADIGALRSKIERFSAKPKISIIMPVYNIDAEYLSQAIESVQAQVYDNWQLCIADDASTEQHIRPLLERYAAADKRIDVIYLDKNLHIAGASEVALSMASGEYVGFLDHDDMLTAHALFAMLESINENPQGEIFYSDEDKIDGWNNRQSPYFKPAWNKDLFYSYNYFCHFTIIKKSVLDKIGGFRQGVDGSQDYDLLLRAVKETGFKNIIHVPHVLYHWRIVEGSVAAGSDQKDYTTQAGIRALELHFDSLGEKNIRIERGSNANTYRVRRILPEKPPLVSLIIPTRDMLEFVRNCVESILRKTEYPNFEIIIVDNQSNEKDALAWFAKIAQDSRVRVLGYDAEFNYSAINNFAVRHANGELIGLINNDIEVITPDWLNEMVVNAIRPEIGCVGAKLLYANNTIQHAGVVLGPGGVAAHGFKGLDQDHPGYHYRAVLAQNYAAVTAACLLLRKDLFEVVGGLDEENFKVAFNDVDLCLKVRQAGYANFWTPYAKLYHLESKSRGYEDTPEKIRRFQKEVAAMKLKWSKALASDPAYSPNLTLDRNDFSIKY